MSAVPRDDRASVLGPWSTVCGLFPDWCVSIPLSFCLVLLMTAILLVSWFFFRPAGGYGSYWSLMPTVAKERFGTKSLGSITSVLALACGVGSYVLAKTVRTCCL